MAPSLLKLSAAALAYTTGVSAVQSYLLSESYDHTNFFDKFDFFESNYDTGDYNDVDPTSGYVNYRNRVDAQNLGLIATQGDEMYIGVDHASTNDPLGKGRNSVRIESKSQYNGGLIVAKFTHLPKPVCGTWPAYWMYGPDWPNGGEIDIYENWNTASNNAITLHTGKAATVGSCKIQQGDFTGSLATANCDNAAAGQYTNQGCSVDEKDGQWGSSSGGIYATEWTADAISIWSWPISGAPSDLEANPDPSGWGKPHFRVTKNSCNIGKAFNNNKIVLNIDFCGVAGDPNIWGPQCAIPTKSLTCAGYVASNPDAFSDVFWKVSHINVFQKGELPISTSSAEEYPSSTTAVEYPTSTTAEEYPTTTASEEYPTSTAAEEYPTSTASEEYPTSTAAEEYPTSTAAEEYPTSTASEEYPTSTASEEYPTSTADESSYPSSTPCESDVTSSEAPYPTSSEYPASSSEAVYPTSSEYPASSSTPCESDVTSSEAPYPTSSEYPASSSEYPVSSSEAVYPTSSEYPVSSQAPYPTETEYPVSSEAPYPTETEYPVSSTESAYPTETESCDDDDDYYPTQTGSGYPTGYPTATESANPTESEPCDDEYPTETSASAPETAYPTGYPTSTEGAYPTDTTSCDESNEYPTETSASAPETAYPTGYPTSTEESYPTDTTTCDESHPTESATDVPYPTGYTTSTVYSTTTYTITSCKPEVTDCPGRIGQVTTEVIPAYTTVCPIEEGTTTTYTTTLMTKTKTIPKPTYEASTYVEETQTGYPQPSPTAYPTQGGGYNSTIPTTYPGCSGADCGSATSSASPQGTYPAGECTGEDCGVIVSGGVKSGVSFGLVALAGVFALAL